MITAAAGVLAYFLQKFADRKNQLINTCREEYTKFISAFQDAVEINTPESVVSYHKAKGILFVVASDSVIVAVGNLNQYMAETSPSGSERDIQKVGSLMTTMFRAMRQDCFESTHLADREITNLLPIEGIGKQT
ncbi:MAG: hypothetical protein H6905_06655 [Hyphomicrobiales bacterium]|nr:hypothetical protein [Hyphomicrobiales bacterium]